MRAHTDLCLPYEPRRPEEIELRTELRARLARLPSRDHEVLHATFFGPKPPRTDLENLLLYNIDDTGRSFVGAQRGLRFELSSRAIPRASHAFTYLYRPVPRTDTFRFWNPAATLATWENVTIETAANRAFVWLGLRTTPHTVAPAPHPGPFGVLARLRPPNGATATAPPFVKPLLDGTVAALQAHGDHTTLRQVSARIADVTRRGEDEIERLLGNAEQAVLGVVPRLVHLRADGFQMSPADDRCIAGELLIDSPNDHAAWSLACTVIALEPR